MSGGKWEAWEKRERERSNDKLREELKRKKRLEVNICFYIFFP